MSSQVSGSIISEGKAILGIEFGSTRIKSVLIDRDHKVIASGSHEWENDFQNGVWTYSEQAILSGLQASYADLKQNVLKETGVPLKRIAALGVSAMMHGYLPFDAGMKLLVPFRTWRNTITGEAAEKLSALFSFNMPQRWSLSHLYQAILNEEPHVKDIRFLTTLAGWIHFLLTGKKVLGVGDASGMMPIDSDTCDYDARMVAAFDALVAPKGFPWKLKEILPAVLSAGEDAGTLTAEGAKLLDPSGDLEPGCPLCPPEGDAGTGMTATNSVRPRTGNVSAGTSIFSMIVLEKPMSKVYPEIDIVTTPVGKQVGMVHCNSCTSDINAWVALFREFAELMGFKTDAGEVFTRLFKKAMEGEKDCGGLVSFNYYAGEPVTGLSEGRPMLIRTPMDDPGSIIINAVDNEGNSMSWLPTQEPRTNELREQNGVPNITYDAIYYYAHYGTFYNAFPNNDEISLKFFADRQLFYNGKLGRYMCYHSAAGDMVLYMRCDDMECYGILDGNVDDGKFTLTIKGGTINGVGKGTKLTFEESEGV